MCNKINLMSLVLFKHITSRCYAKDDFTWNHYKPPCYICFTRCIRAQHEKFCSAIIKVFKTYCLSIYRNKRKHWWRLQYVLSCIDINDKLAQEKFEDTKSVFRYHIYKDRQYNGHMKKDKKTLIHKTLRKKNLVTRTL